jgi:hypothetical protein
MHAAPLNADPIEPLTSNRPGLWSSVLSLFASSSTLICCALPALLVSAVPQLVWLSEHKEALFSFAGLMLAASGTLQWRNRAAACPIDPALRRSCLRTRKAAARMWGASVAIYAVGTWFAFIQPWLIES